MLIKWICNNNKMIPIKDLNYFDVERVDDDEFKGFKFNIEYITAKRTPLLYCDINTIRAYAKKEGVDISYIQSPDDEKRAIDKVFDKFEGFLCDFLINDSTAFDYDKILEQSLRESIK